MKSTSLNVLITTPQWQSALACIQSIGQAKHKVFLWGEAYDHPILHSDHIYKFLNRQSTTIDAQILELENIVRQHDIDLVIPISDQDAEVATALNTKLNSLLCVVGSPTATAAMRDRNKTAELCDKLGIRIPRSSPATHETAQLVAMEIGYPCFLKLPSSVGSQGVFRISDPLNLDATLEKLPSSTEFQIQEQIAGKFSDVTGFAVTGKLIESFAFETDYEQSHSGNPPYASEVNDSRLVEMLRKLVRELEWTGGIDIDLLTDANDVHYLLEINPRLSGTAVFALKVGIDFPMRYIDLAQGVNFPDDVLNKGKKNLPKHFISILEEQEFLGRKTTNKARHKKRLTSGIVLNNLFEDDKGYSRAMNKRLASIRNGLLKARIKRALKPVKKLFRLLTGHVKT
jgi:glutathione synthase/RimK-type ligase-like ATP-grasp enzyme